MPTMRLRPPGVNVYQIFETESVTIFNATLSPCLIGTAKQIRTNKSSGVYQGDVVQIDYPELLLTSIVDKATVKVKIEAVDGTHEIAKSDIPVQGVDGVTNAAQTTFDDAAADFVAAGVAANDTLVINENGVYTAVKVVAVVDENTLTVATGLGASKTGLDYFIFKSGKFAVLDRKVILPAGILFSGPVLISYEAQRTDHTTDFFNISSSGDLKNNFSEEDLVPTNPLPYAYMIAMANGTPGLTIRGLIVEQDTLAEHTVAQSTLGLKDNVWSLVPLTQKPEILSSYAIHATTCSQPLEKKERIVFVSHKLITRDTRLLRTSGSTVETSATGKTSAGTDTFEDATIDFSLTGVKVGDFVNILSGPLAGAYPIDAVTNNHKLSLTLNIASTLTGLEYEIVSNFFDRSEIADNVMQRSAAYANRRVCAIWPHEVDVPDPDGEGVISVPSYYLGAAYAAIAASLPPQTPFSRMMVAGFSGLRYSNDYFTDEELDIMAAGGTWIVVQNGEGANLECRHQLTTDTTTVERREWNITKDVDYIAKTWRQTLTPLTGRNLLTDGFLAQLQIFAQSLLNSAVAGGQLLAGSSLVSVERNPDASDTVDFRFKLNPPRPANTFNLYLVV